MVETQMQCKYQVETQSLCNHNTPPAVGTLLTPAAARVYWQHSSRQSEFTWRQLQAEVRAAALPGHGARAALRPETVYSRLRPPRLGSRLLPEAAQQLQHGRTTRRSEAGSNRSRRRHSH